MTMIRKGDTADKEAPTLSSKSYWSTYSATSTPKGKAEVLAFSTLIRNRVLLTHRLTGATNSNGHVEKENNRNRHTKVVRGLIDTCDLFIGPIRALHHFSDARELSLATPSTLAVGSYISKDKDDNCEKNGYHRNNNTCIVFGGRGPWAAQKVSAHSGHYLARQD